MVGRRGTAIVMGALALGTLGACDRWECDFESHGACIEFTQDPPDLEAAKQRVDRLLALELPYWGLSSLGGWRIQFRDSAEYSCYFAVRNDGCTDYVEQTMSVKVPPDANGCFEASELLHELGHYELGDPMHSSSRWDGVDAQFAPVVWERPDAPPECVKRYTGIRSGIWPVHRNGF